MGEKHEEPSWLLLVPGDGDRTVLYIGGGAPAVTAALSAAFGRVVAVECVTSRPDAAWSHGGQSRAANVLRVRAAALDLPVRLASVDLAVLDGVVDELPYDVTDERPSTVQHQLLQAVHSVLKPGAVVCLGVGNRWVRLRSIRRTSGGYVRSVLGYRELLESVGFSGVRVWCAFPSWEDPKFLVECEQTVFDYFLRVFDRGRRWGIRRAAGRLLHSLGVLKYAAPSYAILAKREASASA